MRPLRLLALICLAALLAGCSDSDSGTHPITVPDAPTGLSVVETGLTSVTLSWNASDGASAYTLYRSPLVSGTPTEVYAGSSTQAVDSDLDYATPYFYWVSASNSAGESDPSESVDATTLTPAGFVVTGSPSGQVDYTFSYSGTSNSKPDYQSDPIGLHIMVPSGGAHAGQWCFYDQIEQIVVYYHPTVTDFPSRTGWLTAAGGATTMTLLTPFADQ